MAYTCILFVHDLEQPNAHALTARGRKDRNIEYRDILPHNYRDAKIRIPPNTTLGYENWQ